MRGLFGGMVTGGMVSALALSVASVMGEQPAGVTPPAPPLVDAPQQDAAADTPAADETTTGLSTPVGSLSVEAPVTPSLPEGEASAREPASPVDITPDQPTLNADTAPLDEPSVVSVEGKLDAPTAGETSAVAAETIDPVFPNPQAAAPQVPVTEENLVVSTAPAAPVVVAEPTSPTPETAEGDTPDGEGSVLITGTEDTAPTETFVVDLGVAEPELPNPAAPEAPAADAPLVEAPDTPVDATPFAENEGGVPPTTGPRRFQLQGGENTLLTDRDTGVIVRRPGADPVATEDTPAAQADAPTATNALAQFAATPSVDVGDAPLMSFILVDDGTMSAAAAALAGLPFDVTIALDPAMAGAADLMARYRADGFEVAVLGSLPEGAVPSDVEIAFESVFQTLPETIAVLDTGAGGLQSDPEVTAQVMDILAAQGRGFVTASQGLNTASRAAEQAGVPAGVIYRDLDADDQDARVIRRFVDQAAFRARQESDVILVGRVRPDTISALILWGTASLNEQVAIVPVSTILKNQ